ncbi:MAG TPA: YraN family protein [Porticoccaceae bacterium]
MKRPALRRAAPSVAGHAAEQAAVDFLRSHGVAIEARNAASRRGEIDIVARDGDLLLFIEVRLRSNPRFGSGAASVDPRKQQRLISAASYYLVKHYGSRPPPCRFDVLSLSPAPEQSSPYRVEWLQDAFRPGF